ncbi:MAG: glycoside hydrolase family 3 C-terminal domain-containing protein [Fibromonadaceae bacterium]|jgi:beta-glucosidase|nr:glycoside hydrolase family 3 C-terminal domain-containing protein [Fibromonadaceae bacterium]
MRYLLFSLLLAASAFAAPLNLTGTVKALSESGDPVKDAVVLLKVNGNLIAYARTLSNASGNFTLLPGKDAPGDISGGEPGEPGEPSEPGGPDDPDPIAKPADVLAVKFVSYQAMDLKGRSHSLNNLPLGIYVILGKTERGKTVNLGKVYHKGGALKIGEIAKKEQKSKSLAKTVTTRGDSVQLIVRKAGYLPKEVEFSSFSEDVGTVVLERDPLEKRIDSVMALMDLNKKIYQMTQAQVGTSFGSGANFYGSVLQGGDGYSSTVLSSMSTAINSASPKIPVTYGKDMMHGAAAINGATIFPHNIGMGATRDSALVRRACEVTAKESWAGNVDLIFGPAISVPQDDKWGRTYEGFGSTPELAVEMGAACVRGYQGAKYNAAWRVIATAKHYLADGGVSKDRGNVTASDADIRRIHLPGYEAAVEQGVLSVMVSFNQINGVHQHIDSTRIIGWLKTELGFDGYVISDWQGIANSTQPGYTQCDYGGSCTGPSLTSDAVRKAINAGVDLAMEPGSHENFITFLTSLVNNGNNGQVSMDRINDAVRRILRAKFRANRMDNIQGPTEYAGKTSLIGSTEHRDVAREAVRKSLVLLKNDNALPISRSAKVFVTGSHATNTGYLCGGWTGNGCETSGFNQTCYGWTNTRDNVQGATSVKDGFNKVVANSVVNSANEANVIVYVTGEKPYAEWHGDTQNLTFQDNTLATLKSQNSGKKIITVFISGRAMDTNSLISNSDAFVAAWLPGSEGAGIAEVLFGSPYNFTGKLPRKWGTYDYGYGLTY